MFSTADPMQSIRQRDATDQRKFQPEVLEPSSDMPSSSRPSVLVRVLRAIVHTVHRRSSENLRRRKRTVGNRLTVGITATCSKRLLNMHKAKRRGELHVIAVHPSMKNQGCKLIRVVWKIQRKSSAWRMARSRVERVSLPKLSITS